MKLLALIGFILLSQGVFAQNSVDKIVVKTHTKCDHCKVCESCAGRMEHDLVYVKGIRLAEYNEKDMTLTITYKTKAITPDEIRKEIAKLGFSADDVPADPKGVASLDGCCRGEE